MRTATWIMLGCLSFGLGCTSWQDLPLQASQVTKQGSRTGYVLLNRHNLKAQRIRCQVPVELTDDPVYATADPDWVEASNAMLAKIDKGCARRILEKHK